MEAYSMDLRVRVIQAYDEGQGSTRQLAEVFDVSSAWIRKLLRLRRETGSRLLRSSINEVPSPSSVTDNVSGCLL